MLRKSATLLLVSTMLTAGAAMAQTGSSGSSTGSSGAGSAQAGGKFITEQTQNEFRASKLVGLNIYGTDNQKIGDINEILVDRTGNAKAAVIGVGGFLGIGEKNVAVPFASLEWVNTRPDANRTASTASGTSDTNRSGSSASNTADANRSTASTLGTAGDATRSAATSAGTAAGMTGNTAPDAATTGTTTRSTADTAASQGYPDHAVLRMTKDDLQNAPTFRYFADANSGSRSGSGNTGSSTSGTAPRQ